MGASLACWKNKEEERKESRTAARWGTGGGGKGSVQALEVIVKIWPFILSKIEALEGGLNRGLM